MIAKKSKFNSAFTLIEVMIAILILSVAVIGTSGYRYHAALDARKAAMQRNAARIGLLFCETWRDGSDPNAFDPTQLTTSDPNSTLLIETADQGPAVPEGFTLLETYRTTLDSVNYYTTLSWNDVSPGLRALNVSVAWDQRGSEADGFTEVDKTFKLTSYITN